MLENDNINNPPEKEKNNKIDKYLNNILDKYNFIELIFLTNEEGASIATANKRKGEESLDEDNKIKILFSYKFKSFYEQISKTEKWGVNCIVSYYDNHIVYQEKINKELFIHFVCVKENYNQELLKDIREDIGEKIEKDINTLENVKKEVVKEN
jgi:hypothetical protein